MKRMKVKDVPFKQYKKKAVFISDKTEALHIQVFIDLCIHMSYINIHISLFCQLRASRSNDTLIATGTLSS